MESWIRDKSISSLSERELMQYDVNNEVDFLLSVNNDFILPKQVLSLARERAINFHNSLLPQYGGCFAPSWAILDKQTVHGVTWHVMTEKIDEGDILLQQEVTILNGDTAFSLGLRCREAAYEAFTRLVSMIENDGLEAHPQRGYTSYRKVYERPPCGGVLTWDTPAEDLATLHRALARGPIGDNSFELCKLLLSDTFLIVGHVSDTGQPTTFSPGTITKLGCNDLRVAAADNEVQLSELKDVADNPIQMDDFLRERGIEIGSVLPTFHRRVMQKILSRYTAVAKQEKYYVKKWRRLLELCPQRSQLISRISESTQAACSSSEYAICSLPTIEGQSYFVFKLAADLWTLDEPREVALMLSTDVFRSYSNKMDPLFCAYFPLSFVLDPKDIRRSIDEIVQIITQFERLGPQGRDFFCRKSLLNIPVPELFVWFGYERDSRGGRGLRIITGKTNGTAGQFSLSSHAPLVAISLKVSLEEKSVRIMN
jgi:methionyl-tRNA formyltransferase